MSKGRLMLGCGGNDDAFRSRKLESGTLTVIGREVGFISDEARDLSNTENPEHC